MENAYAATTRPALIQAREKDWLDLHKTGMGVVSHGVLMDRFDGFILSCAEEKGLFTEAHAINLLPYFKSEPVKRIEAVERVLLLAIREKPDLGPVVFGKLADPVYRNDFFFDYQYYRLLGSVAREMALKERKHPALLYEVTGGVPNIDVFVVNLENEPVVLFNQHPVYAPVSPDKLFSNCDLNIGSHRLKYRDRLNASLRLLFSFASGQAGKPNGETKAAMPFIGRLREMARQIKEYPQLEKELEPGVRKTLNAFAPTRG